MVDDSSTKSSTAGTRTAPDEVTIAVEQAKVSGSRKQTYAHPGVVAILVLALVGVAAAAIALGAQPTCNGSAQSKGNGPLALMGDVVAQCKAELGENSEQCPTPFPEIPASSQSNPSCSVAIVGAGPGGLYAAMRLIETGTFDGSDICIFEMSSRVGGRVYSLRGFGPERNLNVDAGAYRTWPQFTPVTQALLKDKLGFTMGCYDEAEDPCEKFNIMNDEGGQMGFATFVEEMMTIVHTAGARFFPQYKLLRIERSGAAEPATLYFANGNTARTVVLNLPQRPLLDVVRASSLPAGVVTASTYTAMHGVQTEIVTKLYLYYREAWWRYLGLVSGDFVLEGDAQAMPLKGRYHDGDFRCDASKAGRPDECHGFLLAVYNHDYGGEEAIYFRRYQKERTEPISIISNKTVEGRLFLQHAHERLKLYHKGATTLPPGAKAPYEISEVMDAAWNVPPEFGVLATWNVASEGYGGGWHGWTDLSQKSLSESPLVDADILVINEAYSNVQGWAEGSLERTDAALKAKWGIDHPWDFQVSGTMQVVAQTKKSACTEQSTSGGTAGGGGDDGGSHICFTSSAQLSLANGSLISIADARVGDRVATGDGSVGIVTEALVHPHHERLNVAVVETAHGELVGTPTHPVQINGTWLELRDAHATGLLPGVRFETRHVDAFYNLEIDGDKPGESAHAYVVHGLTVSGLGDNLVLNTRFPRQTVWKAKAAAGA